MMQKVKIPFVVLALALGLCLSGTPAADAQVGPWFKIAPDGRVSTYDFTCVGNAYAYVHVLIHTTAGRKVIGFTQACTSSVGVVSKLQNAVSTFPTLLDSDGLVTRIDVLGFQRYSSTTAHEWPIVISTGGDSIDQTIHAGNLPEQTDDSKEPVSKVSFYVYASPPVP